MRVRTCNKSRVKRDQTSCYLRPPFLNLDSNNHTTIILILLLTILLTLILITLIISIITGPLSSLQTVARREEGRHRGKRYALALLGRPQKANGSAQQAPLSDNMNFAVTSLVPTPVVPFRQSLGGRGGRHRVRVGVEEKHRDAPEVCLRTICRSLAA